MNFKTTIILVVALAVAGGVFWFTGGNSKSDHSTDQTNILFGKKLLDFNPSTVQQITIVDPEGVRTTVQKQGDKWILTEPVNAPAADWSVQGLFSTLGDLTSAGQPSSDPGADSGLAKPRYQIEMLTEDGKKIQLAVGNKTAVGDMVYVQVNGGEINLITTEFTDVLKSAQNDLRDKHLLALNDQEINQFRVDYGNYHLSAARVEGKWRILEPVQLPGDEQAISIFLKDVTALEATEFVAPDSDELAYARFDKPTIQIWLSVNPATTQPTTAPATIPSSSAAGETTITIGAPDSLVKDHYFVKTSNGQIAKMSSAALSTLRPTVMDLRDRDIFSLSSGEVQQISILKEIYPKVPATQKVSPSTIFVPVSSQTMVLNRRQTVPKQLGPAMPKSATQAATTATTQLAASQPVEPDSIWEIAGDPRPVDDSKVETLLAKFQPLRALGYRPSPPTGVPVRRYVLQFTTGSTKQELTIVQAADGSGAIGFYNGLIFGLPNDLLDQLDADLHKTDQP